ncbi:bifunctional [glutamate--ammonia ligase]-adenylyl-L-tyrosine phosphorylase/[glutamate--ammonia-ligase] adenylyltransferase [Sandaracinus amylolyticus]|uniref:Glutamate-ammonia-ligase adenylyltransferase n=1 Tax=Sandaracinus amylolyticus TaxID=927083 RepID=A0A0F6SFV9_9BACT|nr:bifunctional [glutamate--ammonia ligase]-adenylyl-L-tyrosine phosphorylase/[glutamate--ammonia-ligase] adenylyltransferase [Sandaracinus amylolyticus]AKF07624.1 Glutamate-ammonia-ligase adenylyltransferase [Sandaracinus amylolyticus]
MLPLAREIDTPAARAAIDAFAAAGGDASHEGARALVGVLGEHAPALLPLALGDPTLPGDVLRIGLARRARVAALIRQFGAATQGMEDGPELRRAMRRLRHRHIVRIALQEILRLADIDSTSAEMAALAAAACDSALEAAKRTVEKRFGVPVGEGGAPIGLTCLGMGKLGGWELNLGSDVDLCFFYETDDGEVPGDAISVHEHHARTTARCVAAISDVTEDGFCFRVDLRLRPEGTRGPLVNSLASAERYYESWGRTWERAALLRARPIAGDRALGRRLLDALRPFVFRRTVDPGIAREMAQMLERSRRELAVDEARDVKLGRGGIREAEFFVQTLQLVWGGRNPQLQVPGTIQALTRLEAAGLVREREARALAAAWARLRRIEHRIHAWSGYQTHQLPPEGAERARFARSLGYDDDHALERVMREDRARIAELFDSLMPEGTSGRRERTAREEQLEALCDRIASGADVDTVAELVAPLLPVGDPHEAAEHLCRLARRADAPLGPVMRETDPELGPRLLEEVSSVADPMASLRHLAEFFARLRGLSHERRLFEDPLLLRRLVALFGTSVTLSSGLIGHPEELDLLLAPGVVDAREVDALHAEVDALIARDDEVDAEAVVAAMRRAKRGATLRAGLALAAGELALDDCMRVLTLTAERQIRAAVALATRESIARFGPPAIGANGERASLVVVAMGKLGARELGFGGDLDLIFLYDEDGDTEGARSIGHAELFSRIAQRTVRVLSQPDGEGPGYATDTRLRPSGAQGTLVVSLASFDRYHHENAAPWERQALLRARPIAGEPALCEAVRARIAAITVGGEPPPPPEALAEMRARIQTELAGESRDRYHPKLGFGGLVDVEFLAQWLQMEQRLRTEPEAVPTTPGLVAALASAGRISRADADALIEGFAFLRAIEQTLKLLDETREPVLRPGSRTAEQLARRLGIRERDGHDPARVLTSSYQRTVEEIRAVFERVIAPVPAPSPWSAEASA